MVLMQPIYHKSIARVPVVSALPLSIDDIPTCTVPQCVALDSVVSRAVTAWASSWYNISSMYQSWVILIAYYIPAHHHHHQAVPSAYNQMYSIGMMAAKYSGLRLAGSAVTVAVREPAA